MIKVIASDMDGTFLDAQGLYDCQRFEALLTQLEERQIRFVVASGNNLDRLSLMFEGLLDRLSFVADNGTHVLDQGQTLVRENIDRALVDDFLAYVEPHLRDYGVMVTTASGIYRLQGAHFQLDRFAISLKEWQSFEERLVELAHFSDLPDEPILKIGMQLPEETCQELIEAFNQTFSGRLTAVTSGFGVVDVILPGRHKAWGLQHLLDKWGVAADEVMAFGDGENDIELLQLAGQSYAMANAPESVQAAAKYLAPHHNHNGVLDTIAREVLGQTVSS